MKTETNDCAFCSHLKETRDVITTLGRGKVTTRLTAAFITTDYQEPDWVTGRSVHGGFELRFCPCCGRELGDDADDIITNR